jgi:hypothetical protein
LFSSIAHNSISTGRLNKFSGFGSKRISGYFKLMPDITSTENFPDIRIVPIINDVANIDSVPPLCFFSDTPLNVQPNILINCLNIDLTDRFLDRFRAFEPVFP